MLFRSITGISNTLPKDKEKVTVYGTGLQETTKVTLPGGIEITADIESDEDGEWYSFIMPENYSGSGSIYSEGANGQAATPAYFNFADCMILDFDGNGSQGFWSWSETGSMINADDLVEDPYDSGRGTLPIRSRIYSCTTSEPSYLPVLVTVTVAVISPLIFMDDLSNVISL